MMLRVTNQQKELQHRNMQKRKRNKQHTGGLYEDNDSEVVSKCSDPVSQHDVSLDPF